MTGTHHQNEKNTKLTIVLRLKKARSSVHHHHHHHRFGHPTHHKLVNHIERNTFAKLVQLSCCVVKDDNTMNRQQQQQRRFRRIVATAAVTCFLLCLAASVAILLREFQSDADAVQRKPMYQHPHAHDGSLLDRLEDVEETVYKRLDPYLRDETGVIGSLRKPIDLPRFHRWQKRDQRP